MTEFLHFYLDQVYHVTIQTLPIETQHATIYILWIDYNLASNLRSTTLNLRANPLTQSLGQVKLDSDKWKLWKNFFE